MSLIVAAELQPARCVIVAVRRPRRAPAEVVAGASFPNNANLAARLREFRRGWQLPPALRLVLWPRAGDPGVIRLGSPSSPDRVRLDPDAMRARARPIVQAGFRVASVTMPPKALAALSNRGARLPTIVLAIERDFGCVVLASDGAVEQAAFLTWPAQRSREDENAAVLARYQFGAQFGPHLRALIARAGGRVDAILACGGLPDLRLHVVPLIEEIDHEVDVLDGALAGDVRVAGKASDAASPAVFQVAVAAAVAPKPMGLGN